MLIRMLTIAAGPQGCLDAGARLDVDPQEARELVDRGFAEALQPFPQVEPVEPPPAEFEGEAEPTAPAAEPEPTATESTPAPARRKAR